MKLPFVKRKTYERDLRRAEGRTNMWRRDAERLEREIDELLRPMVEKFQKTQIHYDPIAFDRYVVQVAFDTHWVESCLLHGNSDREIKYLSEMMGKQVMYEVDHLIRARNIIRTTATSKGGR